MPIFKKNNLCIFDGYITLYINFNTNKLIHLLCYFYSTPVSDIKYFINKQ